MRIHALPVGPEFQPATQYSVSSPLQARNVEQDFYEWLPTSGFATSDPGEADWDYLPIFWGRFWCNHGFGAYGTDELQAETLRLVSRHRPTFTIADCAILHLLPQDLPNGFDFCGLKVFSSSRRTESGSIDIPLLCLPHERVYSHEYKRWLASFVGNMGIMGRPGMAEALSGRDDCFLQHADSDLELFENIMLGSYIALAPIGNSGASFRFYEAMQMGIVPYFIGWPDTRPFKNVIDWGSCSLHTESVDGLDSSLIELASNLDRLLEMGREAKTIYDEHLAFGRWCQYAVACLPDRQKKSQ